MGPKKAAQPLIVGEYDVELMNPNELKMYITALEEELKRMWNTCNIHQTDNRELREFLKLNEENITAMKEEIIQGRVKNQESLNETNEQLKSEDKINMITKLESNEDNDKDVLESFVMFKTEEAEIFEKERSLRRTIEDKDRMLEDMLLSRLFILSDIKEKREESSSRFSWDIKNTFDDFVQQYLGKIQQQIFDFHERKVAKLTSVLEGECETQFLKNNAASGIEKMVYYFRDIFWKNIRTFDELNEEKSELKKECYKVKSRLIAGERKSKKLQTFERKKTLQEFNIDNNDDTMSFNLKLEQLMYENDGLTEKLRKETNEFNLLKERFILAMREIRLKAHFRAYLAEQQLNSLLKTRPSASLSSIVRRTTTDERQDEKKILLENTVSEDEIEKIEEEK